VPLDTLTANVVEPPGQFVTLLGVMLQIGLGTQVLVARQGWLTQFRASVTIAVRVQDVGTVISNGQTSVMFVDPFC